MQHRRTWAFVLGIVLSGCGLVLGDLDVTLGPAPPAVDGSDEGSADAPAATDDGGADAAADAPCRDDAACEGKCGQRLDSCGALATCADCSGGLTCGGGGTPNVCGKGPCTPTCTGKACGESDGCKGVCGSGTCDPGLRCVNARCTCDPISCTSGCCSTAGACAPGTSVSACGAAGAACSTCTPPSGGVAVCDAGGTCGYTCDATHPACAGGCCSVYGNSVRLASTGSYTTSELCARPVTVSSSGTLVDIGVISVTSGVQIALGVYTSVSGAPGALVAQTSAGTLNGGSLLLSTPATALPAGSYFIVASFGAGATINEDAVTTVTSYCSTLTFGSAFPSTFPAVSSYQGRIANFYLLAR
jgi:hypothetical protein